MMIDINSCESAHLTLTVDGGTLSLVWNSATGGSLAMGTSVELDGVRYTLLDPYYPTRINTEAWRYAPGFKHPLERLSRVPFWISSLDSEGRRVQLSTTSITGTPSRVAQSLARFMAEYGEIDGDFAEVLGTGWSVEIGSGIDVALVTASFDGCTVKGAASRIADAIGCNVFFDYSSRCIRFVAGTTIVGDSYTHIHVLGGTRNMAKTSVGGMNAAVTQRLMLPEAYAGSIMAVGAEVDGGLRMTTDVIFDDIYPKMELVVDGVHERVCYLTDEDGNRIADRVGADGTVLAWKTYSKWYIHLGDYVLDEGILIANKTLGLVFQPDYDGANDSPLVGRQFDLVHFKTSTKEWDSTDVVAMEDAWTVPAGWFRICFVADGEYVLPSTSAEGLVPKVGNRVTLVNVRLDERYVVAAQEQLEQAAQGIASMMGGDRTEHTETVVRSVDGGIPGVGEGYTLPRSGYSGVVMNVSCDVHTGVAEVTVGHWGRRGLTSGVRNKIDSISGTGGSGATVGDGLVSESGLRTLTRAGGYGSLVTMNTRLGGVESAVEQMGIDVLNIERQADQAMEIHYRFGAPLPNTDSPDAAANEPASGWITDEEKALHAHDICMDINREPASTGGRAWRWMQGESGRYLFYPIEDADTIAALEKVADVAADGVITGGAEKQRVRMEWLAAVGEYARLTSIAGEYGFPTEDAGTSACRVAYDEYVGAMYALADLLDYHEASNDPDGIVAGDVEPYFFEGDSLYESTVLTPSESGCTPAEYRAAWETYYARRDALQGCLDSAAKERTDSAQSAADAARTVADAALLLSTSSTRMFVSSTLPSAPYKRGDLWYRLDGVGSSRGVLFVCVVDRESGDAGALSDWSPVDQGERDSHLFQLLADVVEEWEAAIDSFFGITADAARLTIYVGGTQPEELGNDIWFNTSSNGIRWRDTQSGGKIVSVAAIQAVAALTGGLTFSVWRDGLSNAGGLYDVYYRRSSFVDGFTHETVTGGLNVWVRGRESWQQVRDGTSGLMENYGTHIVSAVFGVAADGQTNYASGLVTQQNYAQMFAEATDTATGQTALATIAALIEKDADGRATGVVDVRGRFRTADGRVVVDRTESSYERAADDGSEYSLTTVRELTGMTISDSADYQRLVISLEECHSEETGDHPSVSDYTTPSILLRGKRATTTPGSGLSESFTVSRMTSGGVYAPRFFVTSCTSEGRYTVRAGSGTMGSPLTFETADGKRVTVMGGVITSIQQM